MESIAAAAATAAPPISSSFFSNSVSRTVRPFLRAFPCRDVKLLRVEAMRASEAINADSSNPKETKLWGGRFKESVTNAVERFTESISYDKELYKHDIMGSRAHASMLANQVDHLSFSTIHFDF